MRDGWDGERSVTGKGGVLAAMAMQSTQSVHVLLAVRAVVAGMAWSATGRRIGAVVVREARQAWGGESAVGLREQGRGARESSVALVGAATGR